MYALNKANSRTKNTKPTKTDQSQAHETDRNVIVKRFMVTGQLPGQKQGFIADMSQFPTNLADFIALGRTARSLRGRLPEQLRDLSLNDLLSLTPDELRDKLKKPDDPAPASRPDNQEDKK